MDKEKQLRRIILNALEEDISEGDWTTFWLVPREKRAKGEIVVKEDGVIAGLEVAKMVFGLMEGWAGPAARQPKGRTASLSARGPRLGAPRLASPALAGQKVKFTTLVKDGSRVKKGEVVALIEGSARTILTTERTALNFLQRMSGIATLTNKFVEAVKGTKAAILDIRKTAPGLRLLDKWAVRLGGGRNHRFGLYDMVLIKDNHLEIVGSISKAVEMIREKNKRNLEVEVEVENFKQLKEALSLGVRRILLDNMTLDQIKKAVKLTAGKAKLEVSGGVNLNNVRQIAQTGVDYISVGALTHSAKALDMSLEVISSSS